MTDTPDLTQWHQSIASVLESASDSDRIGELLGGIEGLVQGSSSMAILYSGNRPPEITHHRLLADEKPHTQVNRYVNGAYLLDPFYNKAVNDQQDGLFLLHDVAPDAFQQTEYFRMYYREARLVDEACYLVSGDGGTIASLSIGRTAELDCGYFSGQERALLQSLLPLVQTVLKRWIHNRNGASARQENFGSRLDHALDHFGSSVLTRRECEVLHMTMRGHSIKSIAAKLDTSVDTIKTHRKHIYSKLDVGSQAELFYLFIRALREHTGAQADPLADLNG